MTTTEAAALECPGRGAYLYSEHRDPRPAAVRVLDAGAAEPVAYCRKCYVARYHAGEGDPTQRTAGAVVVPAHELAPVDPSAYTVALVDPGEGDHAAPRLIRRPWTRYPMESTHVPERTHGGPQHLPFAVILAADEPYDLSSLATFAEERTNSRQVSNDVYRLARNAHYAYEEATASRYTTSTSREHARGQLDAYAHATAILADATTTPLTFLAAILADGGARVTDPYR